MTSRKLKGIAGWAIISVPLALVLGYVCLHVDIWRLLLLSLGIAAAVSIGVKAVEWIVEASL